MCHCCVYFLVNQVFLILLLIQADQDIILAVFERFHPAYSLNFVEHLLYVILLLFSLLTLHFKVVGVPHLIE